MVQLNRFCGKVQPFLDRVMIKSTNNFLNNRIGNAINCDLINDWPVWQNHTFSARRSLKFIIYISGLSDKSPSSNIQLWPQFLLYYRNKGAIVSATRCFLLEQKISFLAEVVEFWNLENTGNYSTRTNFKRDFPKVKLLELQSSSKL